LLSDVAHACLRASLLSDVAHDEVKFWRVVPSVRRVEFISPSLPEDSAVCFEEVELRRREQLRCAHTRRDGSKSLKRKGIILSWGSARYDSAMAFTLSTVKIAA
jgi:hypothetical protein